MKSLKRLLFLSAFIILVASCKDDTPDEPNFNIYEGAKITFTKTAGSDPTEEANQDRINDDVWLTRGNEGGQIFNIVTETASNKDASPADTRWSFGTTAEIEDLDFKPFREAVEIPKDIVDKDLVLYLVGENAYVDIKFLDWGVGQTGAFSYERRTK